MRHSSSSFYFVVVLLLVVGFTHAWIAAVTAATKRSGLSMRVIPISKEQMSLLVPKKVKPDQMLSYWGVNKKERLQRVLESLLVSYGGAWMAWFVSFMAGSLVSAVLGSTLIFNWLYSPWLNARKRNAKIWPRTGQDIYYALFLGRIRSLERVKRRAGKTIGAVAQEYFVLNIEDEKGRELEIITQWQDSYSSLRPLMSCSTVLVSSSNDFSTLSMVTDLWVPSANSKWPSEKMLNNKNERASSDVWVGDYPYLQREEFSSLVAQVSRQNTRRKKKAVEFDDEDDIDPEKARRRRLDKERFLEQSDTRATSSRRENRS